MTVIRSSLSWQRSFAILTSVPRVGIITAAALIGVAPFATDGGKLKGARQITGGRY
ncbi:MAG: hypothetical protein OXE94_04485 [Aestuariivita sp.]|nr:hypothetical protein [Aestuariivita sp.]MCY4201512.1 hypothetical protein [Aestuariivita sp.]